MFVDVNDYMCFDSILRNLICLIVILHPTAVLCFETDQYSLPPRPLADIGDEVSEYVEENLRKALARLNAEIAKNEDCRRRSCKAGKNIERRLNYLRSEEAVAIAVFRRLGDGIVPFTKSGRWMDSHKFRAQPARYKTGYSESIYSLTPTNYFTISPTVKVYGVHFGTDKVAHFFQQGYTYYRVYLEALKKGASSDEATRKAVAWGVKTEHTYFGTLVSGVYSNADLFANYVGMEFYQGLTREIKIGSVARPAIVELVDGSWRIQKGVDLKAALIKPFMTDHMNEALNPSMFIAGLRSHVRKKIGMRCCPMWLGAFPGKTRMQLETYTASLETWNGNDYGFKRSSKPITIANTCFSKTDGTN